MEVSTVQPSSTPPAAQPVASAAEALAQMVMERNLAPKLVKGHVEPHEVGVKLDPARVSQAIEDMRSQFDLANHKLEYSVHESSHKIVVRISDRQSGQVIREVPDSEFLDLVSRLQDLVGFIINAKV